MRVLWFTNTSSCYSENEKNTTGGVIMGDG